MYICACYSITLCMVIETSYILTRVSSERERENVREKTEKHERKYERKDRERRN